MHLSNGTLTIENNCNRFRWLLNNENIDHIRVFSQWYYFVVNWTIHQLNIALMLQMTHFAHLSTMQIREDNMGGYGGENKVQQH